MTNDRYDKVRRINGLSSDMDALYHRAALKLGVPDSVMFVLYVLNDRGDGCLLYDICRETGISKQTINSAMRKLEGEGILYLEQDKGKTKRVCLTEKGREYIDNTAARLFEAECRVFESWPEDEFEQYLRLMEKYNQSFRAELERL